MFEKKLLQEFFSTFPQGKYRKRELILKPYDPLSMVYFIEAGSVRMYSISPEGQEVTIHIFKEGASFPLMLILAEVENTHYFEAVDAVIVRKAPKQQVLDYLQSNSDAAMELTVNFAKGINGLATRIEHILNQKAHIKVAALLLYLSKRFGEKINEKTVINTKLTHTDIAAWLGVARETVSRQIELLEKERIIDYKGNMIEILDIDKLHEITSE